MLQIVVCNLMAVNIGMQVDVCFSTAHWTNEQWSTTNEVYMNQ